MKMVYMIFILQIPLLIFGEVPIATCLGMALTQKLVYKEIYYSMAVCLGLICYEVIGLTFDYKDIIATFIGALLSYAINKMVIRYSC